MNATDANNALSLRKRLVFGLLTCFLVVFLLEAFFRILPFHQDADNTVAGLVDPDPDLIWRLRPYKDGPVATNELGFRDTSYHPDAAIKIVLLGDSVSWGDGVGDVRQVYPWLLENLLSQMDGQRYEVINTAVPGYSTFQELRFLQLYGMQFKPDMIILQFCLNDVVERYSRLAQYGGDNVFLGIDTRGAMQGVSGWFVRHSRFVEASMRMLVGVLRNQQEYQVEKMATDKLSKELEQAWRLTLSEIEQMRQLAATNNLPFMILVTPYRFQLDRPEQTNQPQRMLKHYADTHHVPIIDLLPFFASFYQDNATTALFNDANHFSIRGHALASEILSREILRLVKGAEKPEPLRLPKRQPSRS